MIHKYQYISKFSRDFIKFHNPLFYDKRVTAALRILKPYRSHLKQEWYISFFFFSLAQQSFKTDGDLSSILSLSIAGWPEMDNPDRIKASRPERLPLPPLFTLVPNGSRWLVGRVLSFRDRYPSLSAWCFRPPSPSSHVLEWKFLAGKGGMYAGEERKLFLAAAVGELLWTIVCRVQL